MFRASLMSLLLSGSLFAGVHGAQTSVHWGYYNDDMSPDRWAKVSRMCGIGQEQTPIDIKSAEAKPLPKEILSIYEGRVKDVDVVNNGHTIKVIPHYNHTYNHGYITIEGDTYELLQFHFHSHSESTIDGDRADLVAHLVHQSYDGELAVLSVFFKEGEENKELAKLWENMPMKAGEHHTVQDIDMHNIMPENIHSYYHLMGSLTTPPCSEGVKWFFFKEKATISKEQIAKFRSLYPKNYRPLQDSHHREIFVK